MAPRRGELEPSAGDRAELLGRLAKDRVVQELEDAARLALLDGGGAQRVAGEPGGRGRGGALADHVADDDGPASVVALEQVVEVAADQVALPAARKSTAVSIAGMTGRCEAAGSPGGSRRSPRRPPRPACAR